MKGKFTLMTALWLAMAGTAAAESKVARYPTFPSYPPLDQTEQRLQDLEWLVNQLQIQIQSLKGNNQALRSELANLVDINDFVTLETVHGRPTVRFSAVNVQVVNGNGSRVANGVGNILIGYDNLRNVESGRYSEECSQGTNLTSATLEPVHNQAECLATGGTWGINHKGGSHYLIVGDEHNYSRWAGIVIGLGSSANSGYASVAGGLNNQAAGIGSAVSGGTRNRASGWLSSITGGQDNVADGQTSSVTGGLHNNASGPNSSVTGGGVNEASYAYSTISGGTGNTAAGESSSISGGAGNVVSGYASSISGGRDQDMTGDFGWTAGGY